MFMDPMPLALLKRARSEEDGGCDDAAMTRDDAMRWPRPAGGLPAAGRRRGAVPVSGLPPWTAFALKG
jgi:hypothetical protein